MLWRKRHPPLLRAPEELVRGNAKWRCIVGWNRYDLSPCRNIDPHMVFIFLTNTDEMNIFAAFKKSYWRRITNVRICSIPTEIVKQFALISLARECGEMSE